MKSIQKHSLAGVLGLVVACVLSACTSTADDASGNDPGPSSDAARQALETAYQGVTGTPPTEPTTPKPGVKLWVVSCGEQIPSCATPTAAAKEAGEAAGWEVSTCDGQLNPNGWGNCIRQASSAGADVVIPIGIDCVAVQAPLQEAQAQGLTIIGGGGADCDVVGGPKLMDAERLDLADVSIEEYWKLNGELQANWLIGKTDGQAKVLLLNFTDPLWGPWITAGFKEALATCEECEVVETLDVSNADVAGNRLVQKFSSSLLGAAEANAVSMPLAAWLNAGLAQSIQSSGKADSLAVATGFGDASTMQLIEDSRFRLGALGYAIEWGAWGSVDTAIRVLNGEEPLVQGAGFQMVDKDENLPESGNYTGGVDYEAEYKKAWGVG